MNPKTEEPTPLEVIPGTLTEVTIKAPLSKPVGFQFDVKQWLGDHMIMAMSYAEQGMHTRLLCIAWQETPPCTLPNDDQAIAQWLNIATPAWINVHKPKVMRAWKVVPSDEAGAGRWISEGLQRSYLKQVTILAKRSMAAQVRWQKDMESKQITENISNDTSASSAVPLIADPEDKTALIWAVGLQLLSTQYPAPKARTLIGRWIKDYGETLVAATLSELSLKASTVADRHTYVTGILSAHAKISTQRKASPRGDIVL